MSAFGTAGLDQRIKVMLPLADGTISDIGVDAPTHGPGAGAWYQRWLGLPDERRNPIRTYTVRAVRPEVAEIDVDFVVHGAPAGTEAGDPRHSGPAATWLAQVSAGDTLVVVGPDALSLHSGTGIDWRPGSANALLLAGDETAAPAICSILESLPEDVVAHAFIEVPDAADALPVEAPPRCCVTWLARGSRGHGEALDAAIRAWVAGHGDLIADARPSGSAGPGGPADLEDIDVDTQLLWDSPDAPANGGFYAWLAGEAGAIKALRRFLVTDTGVDRTRVAFMGYWRMGRSES
jgi:NADPH-dependent ferric siderophore reductase